MATHFLSAENAEKANGDEPTDEPTDIANLLKILKIEVDGRLYMQFSGRKMDLFGFIYSTMGAIRAVQRGPSILYCLKEEPIALVFLKADGPRYGVNIKFHTKRFKRTRPDRPTMRPLLYLYGIFLYDYIFVSHNSFTFRVLLHEVPLDDFAYVNA